MIKDAIREGELFNTFITRFEDRHPEYEHIFAALNDPGFLRSLIAEPAAKGVFPERDRWYRDTGTPLLGDREAFMDHFERENRPNEGANGHTQSDARSSVSGWDASEYVPGAPTADDIIGYRQLHTEPVKQTFDEN